MRFGHSILNCLTNRKAGLYTGLLLLVAVCAFVYPARTNGLFACQAPANDSDQYIGHCNVTGFGDYDHGAFWFGLESQAERAAAAASVLFVGNSRMQFALSTDPVDHWFKSRALNYYLLGFSHHENHLFYKPLLRKMKPEADVYVINLDGFFEDKISGPANSLMSEPESLNRYKQKFYWLRLHERICGSIESLCGLGHSFIRTRTNGAWYFKGAEFLSDADFGDQPIQFDQSLDPGKLAEYEHRARSFVAAVGEETRCFVLANIPNSGIGAGTARALAERLDMPLVAPEMDGLKTFDGSHLDPESAARWSETFIEELAPQVARCMQRPG